MKRMIVIILQRIPIISFLLGRMLKAKLYLIFFNINYLLHHGVIFF